MQSILYHLPSSPFTNLTMYAIMNKLNGLLSFIIFNILSINAFQLTPNDAKQLDASNAIWSGPSAEILQFPADWSRNIFPKQIHSHNDYWRGVPILDALANGVLSMESDVWLNPDDKVLYVGHDPFSLSRTRTFQNLTLNPLKAAIDQANEANHLHPRCDEAKFFANLQKQSYSQINPSFTSWAGFYTGGTGLSTPLQLLIDVKTDGNETFPYILRQLQPLADQGYLTRFDTKKNQTIPGPITIIGTGNTPINQLINLPSPRFVYFDCPMGKLDTPFVVNGTSYKYDKNICGIASTNLASLTNWTGINPITDAQKNNLTQAVNQAHSYGIKTRIWDTPNWPVFARDNINTLLLEIGSDWINADDLKAIANF